MMLRLSPRPPAWFAAGLLLAAAPAAAQTAAPPVAAQPSANEIALAREQSRVGAEAARAGRWREALESFQRAYQLHPRTQTLLNLGTAQVSLGMLVQGTETYRRFLQEAVASGPLAQYRATAEQALQDIAARIPRIQLSAVNLAPTDQLTLDGANLSNAAVGARLPVDPGAHVLVVTRRGSEIARNGFTINERQSQTIELRLPVAPPTPVVVQGGGGNGNGGGNGGGGAGGNGGGPDPRSRAWAGMALSSAPPATPPPSGGVARSPFFWIGMILLAGGIAAGATVGALYGGPLTPAYVGNVGMGRINVQ